MASSAEDLAGAIVAFILGIIGTYFLYIGFDGLVTDTLLNMSLAYGGHAGTTSLLLSYWPLFALLFPGSLIVYVVWSAIRTQPDTWEGS